MSDILKTVAKLNIQYGSLTENFVNSLHFYFVSLSESCPVNIIMLKAKKISQVSLLIRINNNGQSSKVRLRLEYIITYSLLGIITTLRIVNQENTQSTSSIFTALHILPGRQGAALFKRCNVYLAWSQTNIYSSRQAIIITIVVTYKASTQPWF